MVTSNWFLFTAVCIALSGCTSVQRSDTQAYRQSVMTSTAYHAGFSDGCSVANYNWNRQKLAVDQASFQKEPDYRQGFLVGTQNYKDTPMILNTGRPNEHVML